MTRQYTHGTQDARRPPFAVDRAVRRGAGSYTVNPDHQEARTIQQGKATPSESESLEALPLSFLACGFIVPSQFFIPAQRSHMFWQGEQRLLFAVLQDAVECWFRYRDAATPREHRLFGETAAWFESADTSWLYAFERICEILDLDSNYIRRGLRCWRSIASVPPTLSSGVRRRTTSSQLH